MKTVFIATFFLFFTLLFAGFTPFKLADKSQLPAPTTTEENQEIPIPESFKNCHKDSDCEYAVIACSCCKFDAILKTKQKHYAEFERKCIDPSPPCACKEPETTPKCLNNRCTLQ